MLGRSHVQIAEHNRRVVLEALRRDGPMTRPELASRTRLTAPAITNIAGELLDERLISVTRQTGGGRLPSASFAMNPDGAFGVGVRVRADRADAALIDLAGRVVTTRSWDRGPREVAAIAQAIREFEAQAGQSGRLLGAGVATGGDVTFDLQGLQEKLAPLTLYPVHETEVAVLAERHLGAIQPDGGIVLLLIEDGIKAGLLFRGVPFGGVHGKAGRLGAMLTGKDHAPLDSVASTRALREMLPGVDPAERADPRLERWIENAANHLLDAIVAIAGFLAPGAILIGGDLPVPVIEALIGHMQGDRGELARRPVPPPWLPAIRAAAFPGTGVTIGAALSPFFETILPRPGEVI